MSVNNELINWVELQPSAEEMDLALEEVQEMVEALEGACGYANVVKVLKWAYASQVIPFQFEGGCKCGGHCSR